MVEYTAMKIFCLRPRCLYITLNLLFSFLLCSSLHADNKGYRVSIIPTPVLNTPDFSSVFGGSDGKTVKLDQSGLIREMEYIALPGTVFEIENSYPENGHSILKVRTSDYPSGNGLYIDSRFVRYTEERPPERTRILPPAEVILRRMSSMEGAPYMWGGNIREGVAKMTEFYPPSGRIDETTRRLWRLEGVDCSGLLYQAADGYTPRNTSSLVNYGSGLNIAGLSAKQISLMLRPLDLIVWSGHVIIVFDEQTVIESSGQGGVKRSNLRKKLEGLVSERVPVNNWNSADGKRFVIRRWYPAERDR
ncbi:MAG: NlpC/P60 family protein [Candidatus Omnitrophica bacterium]|nr:NlpC/P60 family protein [Candidatus Omnitrophota bacterium]